MVACSHRQSVCLLKNTIPGRRRIAIVMLVSCLGGPLLASGEHVFSVDPRRTYLRTNRESPGGSIPVALSDLAIVERDWIQLTQLGAFSFWGPHTPDTGTGMIGVFSGSSTLGPHAERYRVEDAIDAGDDIVTAITYWQQLPTDIPQDFRITDKIIIQVPTGATHLFVAAHDSFYSDNSDVNADFAIAFVPCDPSPVSPPDCNGNSIPDECEIAAGLNSDCNANDVPDECDLANGDSSDGNGNGVPDECEIVDSDHDGLDDDTEDELGTDPHNPDSDGDGLLDGAEVDLAGDSRCPDPLTADSDGDTLPDGEEQLVLGTDPCRLDTDEDGIPDNLDPLPLDPGGTEAYLEQRTRELSAEIGRLELVLLSGPNDRSRAGRRGALSNRAAEAAGAIAAGAYADASDALHSLRDRVDGEPHPKDWIVDSDQRDAIVEQLDRIILLIDYLVPE